MAKLCRNRLSLLSRSNWLNRLNEGESGEAGLNCTAVFHQKFEKSNRIFVKSYGDPTGQIEYASMVLPCRIFALEMLKYLKDQVRDLNLNEY